MRAKRANVFTAMGIATVLAVVNLVEAQPRFSPENNVHLTAFAGTGTNATNSSELVSLVFPDLEPFFASVSSRSDNPVDGSTASAIASISFSTGRMQIFATAGLPASGAAAEARLIDLLYFQAPGSPDFIDVGVSFVVSGSLSTVGFPPEGGANLFASGNGGVGQFVQADAGTAFGNFDLPVHLGGTVRVFRVFGYEMILQAGLFGQARFGGTIDLSQTGTLSLDLPPGVTFTSASGVFLSEASPAVQADAGTSQTVDEGTLVTLDGTGSTGQNLSYAWSQVSPADPLVSLSDSASPTPTFTAPTLPGGFGSQVFTFELTVTSGGASSTATVDVTVKNINHPPVAEAGGDQSVNEGSLVTLDGTSSYDPDGDPLVSYQWTQTGGPTVVLSDTTAAQPTFTAPLLTGGVGGTTVLTFQVTVADGQLTGTDEVVVTVEQVNHPPTANAGTDQTKREGSPVMLDGTGSSDPDGDTLTYAWSQVSGPSITLSDPASPTPSFTAPAVGPGGAMVLLELIVNDGAASSDPSQVHITLQNVSDPPVCTAARAHPSLLWPPNHRLVPVIVAGVTDPDHDRVKIRITAVTQDEPVRGPGYGRTSPDAVIWGRGVLLRAERFGGLPLTEHDEDDAFRERRPGNGRVYEIHFSADDGQDGRCTGTVTVAVPPNLKPGTVAIDDGQFYDATQP